MSIIALLHILATSSALDEEVCRSESCNYFAANLRSDMNVKIDPCTDFYEYVCGNWNKNHPLPEHYKWLSNLVIAANKTYHRLREILETDSIDGESTAIIKAKQLYRSCIDTSAIANERHAILMNYMNQTGGWPIIMSPTEWEGPRKHWQTINIENSLVTGLSPIFKLFIKPMPFESSLKFMIAIAPPYSTDDFHDFELGWKYMEKIEEMAGILARKREFVINETQVEKDARKIFQLRASLWLIAKDTVTGHREYKTIDEFQTFYDSTKPKTTAKINWLNSIREIFARTNSTTIKGSETIIVYDKKYFKRLSRILPQNSDRDIVNFIQWWFIEKMQYYDEYPVHGPNKVPPRWMECVKNSELKEVLAFAWVQKYVPEEAKAKVIDIANNIKIEMKNEIDQSEWLNDGSKNATKEKLANMALLIGYPGWYKNSSVLDEYYKNLSIGSSFVENVLRIKRFAFQQQLESFREQVDNRFWSPSPLDVNSHYFPKMNSVVLPAGMLQMPFFAVDFPDVINYAVIGVYIGHEITHGFTRRDFFRNKDGGMIKLSSDSTIQEYYKRIQCFIDHYNRHGGSGKRTLNENIADSNGFSVAFKAYKKLIEKPEFRNVTLPGFNDLTTEQLFFVSFAGSFCNGKPQHMAKVDEHSHGRLRVLGVLSNSKDFADSFQCLEGSRMNPSKKCTIL